MYVEKYVAHLDYENRLEYNIRNMNSPFSAPFLGGERRESRKPHCTHFSSPKEFPPKELIPFANHS